MRFAGFHQGRTRAWVGPLIREVAPDLADPDSHEVPVVEVTMDFRPLGEALARVAGMWGFSRGDGRPYDTDPDRCWRCNAAQGETDVGLCPMCHVALTNAT